MEVDFLGLQGTYSVGLKYNSFAIKLMEFFNVWISERGPRSSMAAMDLREGSGPEGQRIESPFRRRGNSEFGAGEFLDAFP